MFHLSFESHNVDVVVPFNCQGKTITSYASIVVELKFSFFKGYGEIVVIGDVAPVIAILEKEKRNIEQYAYNGPERFWHFLHHLIPNQEAIIAGLDMASWDLYAKMKKVPMHRVLGMQWKDIKPSLVFCTPDPTDALCDFVSAQPASGYLLQANAEDVVTQVTWLKNVSKADIIIELDTKLGAAETKALLEELFQLGIRAISLPHIEELSEQLSDLKLVIPDVQFLMESTPSVTKFTEGIEYFVGAVINLAICGGITPALQMMQIAKKHKKTLLLASSHEVFAGAFAQAHLIPVCDWIQIDAPHRTITALSHPLKKDAQGLIQMGHMPGSGYHHLYKS